jgi:hypothetical protein
VSEYSLDARDGDTGTGLLLNIGDFVVVNNNGVSGSALTKASSRKINGEANSLRERSVTIGSKNQLISTTKRLTPGSLHKGIVGREDDNVVNPLGLDFIDLLDKRWNVVGSAGGGESARNRDNDNLLVGKLLFGIVNSRNTAG